MPLTISCIQVLIVRVDLVHVEVAFRTVQLLTFAVVLHVTYYAVRHVAHLHWTERTLLALVALCACDKVRLSLLVSECLSAVVRAAKLAQVEHVHDLAGDAHLFKLLLAKRAYTIVVMR